MGRILLCRKDDISILFWRPKNSLLALRIFQLPQGRILNRWGKIDSQKIQEKKLSIFPFGVKKFFDKT